VRSGGGWNGNAVARGTLGGREEMGRDGGRGWGVGDEGAAEVCVEMSFGEGRGEEMVEAREWCAGVEAFMGGSLRSCDGEWWLCLKFILRGMKLFCNSLLLG